MVEAAYNLQKATWPLVPLLILSLSFGFVVVRLQTFDWPSIMPLNLIHSIIRPSIVEPHFFLPRTATFKSNSSIQLDTS
jgi:hypothetical protein